MTNTEVAIIVRMFETNWPGLFDASHATIALWTSEIGDLAFGDGVATSKRIIETKDRPPPVSVFLAEYRNITAARGIDPATNPTEECEHCDHGVIPGKPIEYRMTQKDGSVRVTETSTVKPCQHCRPAQYAAWRERTEKANRVADRQAEEGERTYPANPVEGIARARDALAATKPWTPPREEVKTDG